MSWDIFWAAVSSIATLAAVITALFIVKWQDIINNRKSIKIELRHCDDRVTYEGLQENRPVDALQFKFFNNGNRKVIIEGVKFTLKNGESFGFTDLKITNENDFTLPCVIEIEEAKYMKIPTTDFNIFINSNKMALHSNENFTIQAEDTTGKKYIYNSGIRYADYIQKFKAVK